MKKVFILTIVALFAFGMVACGDDDDGGGACDDLANAVQADIDAVCADFPDCTLCEAVEEGEGEELTEEECQALLDEYDSAAVVEGYTTLCEMEEGT
jgi:hypothetical protein